MDSDGIIRGPSLGEEISLALTDDLVQMRLDPRSNDFGDDLIVGVTESNGSKISEIGGIEKFRNEKKVGSVHLFLHSTGIEGILAELNDLRAHNVPKFLEKQRVNAIRSRTFPWFKGEDNLLDFLGGGN